MNLQDFCFPVEERDVSFLSNSRFYDWNTKSYIFKPTNKPTEQYKAIVRNDNNALIPGGGVARVHQSLRIRERGRVDDMSTKHHDDGLRKVCGCPRPAAAGSTVRAEPDEQAA